MTQLTASDLAALIGGKLVGEDCVLLGACPISEAQDGFVSFVVGDVTKWQAAMQSRAVLIVAECPEIVMSATYIIVTSPRLAFARVLQLLYPKSITRGVHQSAIVAPTVSIPESVSVGPFCVIEDNCLIGEESSIGPGAVIRHGTRIGAGCVIGSNTSIGGAGYGFEKNESGMPLRIPHIGHVVIGNNVEIGCNVVIARGTLDATVIEDDCKIDDLVFIAHNVRVGRRTYIIANAQVSGSVTIGEDCWIAPNVSIRQKILIGDRAVVGIGSVVVADIPSDTTVVGNPARTYVPKLT